MNEKSSVPHKNGKFRQFFAAIVANMLTMSAGTMLGWTSPTIPQLLSHKPPVGNEPFDKNQIAWINSLLSLGAFLIVPFCGILVERLGRRNFTILRAPAHIIFWLLVIFAQNYHYLYAARLFSGMGMGMIFLSVPLYTSEIATEEIRGTVTSLLMFFKNVGVLVAYVLGSFASFRQFGCLALLVPLIFVVIFSFMPETPAYLVNHNRSLQAYKSLMFFRGNNKTIVEQELAKLQSLEKTSTNTSTTTKLKDFLKDRATRKGLILSIGLLSGQQLSGIFAMLSYAETIFGHVDSSLSASTASIVIAVIQIIGSCASTMMIENTGRRRLALISCSGMAITHCTIGLFFYLQHNNYDISSISWLPVVALSIYFIMYVLGMGPVPFIIISERFRLDVSSFASTLCCVFYWMVSSVSIQAFDMVRRYFGVHAGFFMFSIFCSFSFVFTYYLVPETKGRERQDIVNELAGVESRQKKDGHWDIRYE